MKCWLNDFFFEDRLFTILRCLRIAFNFTNKQTIIMTAPPQRRKRILFYKSTFTTRWTLQTNCCCILTSNLANEIFCNNTNSGPKYYRACIDDGHQNGLVENKIYMLFQKVKTMIGVMLKKIAIFILNFVLTAVMACSTEKTQTKSQEKLTWCHEKLNNESVSAQAVLLWWLWHLETQLITVQTVIDGLLINWQLYRHWLML